MFFTPVKLSKKKSKTLEGFLVVEGCAIARTGFQLYSENEVALPPGPDGIIRVERDADEVFAADAMASGEGKSIADDHPGMDITPENWRQLAHGHMQNVRRGEGVQDHLLLADLVFKSPESIQAIEADPEQDLSCGYQSQYQVYGPGRAAQRNIRINHVAFLRHKEGRCGSGVCSVKDSAMIVDKCDLWGVSDHEKSSCTLPNCCTKTTTDSAMRVSDWMKKMKDAVMRDDKEAMKAAMADSDEVMKLTGDPEHSESTTHLHIHLGGPETTKPEGGLPETGETRVTTAKDNSASMFGEKIFFQDAETNTAFHEKLKGMDDSIEALKKTCTDGFEEMKKHMDAMSEEAKKAGTTVDAVEGEEPAHEKANKKIEGELKEEAPQATGDAVIKATDSAILVDSFADTIRDAAILVPSIAIPTFDSKLPAAEGYAAVCALRKKALVAFSATEDGAKILTAVTRVTDFAGCSCRDATSAFRAAVAVRNVQLSTANMRGMTAEEIAANAKRVSDAASRGATNAISFSTVSLADVQRMNDEFNQQAAE